MIDDVELNGDRASPGEEFEVRAGEEVTVLWDVDNIGSGDAGSSSVLVRLINDEYRVFASGTNTTSSIDAGESDNNESETLTIPANLAPGLYGIQIIADHRNDVTESNENNNEFLLLVRVLPAGAPDLVIDDVEINGDPVSNGGTHEISVRAGDTISLRWDVDNRGDGVASGSDTGIYLSYGGETAEMDHTATAALGAGDSDNDETDSFILFPSLEPGRYLVELRADHENVVTESSETNNGYRFYINIEGSQPPPPPPPGATDSVREGTDTTYNLPLDELRSGTIDAEPISGDGTISDQQGGMVDKDWYKVTLEKGHDYYFGASSTSVTTGQVAISLYNAQGTLVGSVIEGSSPSFTFSTHAQSTATQTYYLAVSAGGQEPAWRIATGDYAVVVQDTGGPLPPPPPGPDDYRDSDTDRTAPLGSLDSGFATGIIGAADADDDRGDKDLFKVRLDAGKTYVITMTGDGVTPLAESIFTVRSIGDFNTILATSTEGVTARMEFYSGAGGDFYLRAGSGGPNFTTAQGGYRIDLDLPDETVLGSDPGNTPASALPVSLVGGIYTHTGSVGGGDPADIFKITSVEDGVFLVRLEGLSGDADLALLDADGRTTDVISRNSGRTPEEVSYSVVADEAAYINVSPYSLFSTSYTLKVTFQPTKPETTSTLPTAWQLVGDHLLSTLAQFSVGAYEGADATTARTNLISDGWRFFDYENIAGTPLAGLPWSGIFYNNSVAQAVVARGANAIVISFRGTNYDGLGDVSHWLEMDEHLSLFAPLVQSMNALISTDSTIRYVYVTGHSLGAAMVDPFMATHPNFTRADGSTVAYRAVSFGHPDYQTNGSEAILNGLVSGFKQGLVHGVIDTYFSLRDGVPNFGADSRLTIFHNFNDPVKLADFQSDGLIPRTSSLIHYTGGTAAPHSAQLYVYASDFLARSGVSDSVVSLALNGSRSQYLIPSPGTGIDNALSSLVGNRVMVGGAGSDTYISTANGIYRGDVVVESGGVADTLRLTSGFGAFNGTVRASVSANGRDLFIYPVDVGLVYSSELPFIRIFNHFSNGGQVEWIEWSGRRIQLPATPEGVGHWNELHFRIVNPAAAQQREHSDGTVTPFVLATGGPGVADTVSFEGLKTSFTANLNEKWAEFSDAISVDLSSKGADEAIFSTSTLRMVRVDITGMENVIGSAASDTIIGSNLSNSLDGRGGDDVLTGGAGNDVLIGGSGMDLLDGGAGDDTLYLGELGGGAAVAAADTARGGPGNDTYFVDSGAAVVFETAGEGSDRVLTIWSYALAASAEVEFLVAADAQGTDPLTLTGNGFTNTATGNAGANSLLGMGGNDVLEGLAGHDTLDGGPGADAMRGGLGDDTYSVDNALDTVTELTAQGTDTVRSAIGYTLGANVENLVMTGTAAINGTGNYMPNTINGNGAANRLDGGGSVDTMIGGSGNDFYLVDNSTETVVELAGGGMDTVQTAVAFRLPDEVEVLILTGTGAVNGTGNGLANTLHGNDGANTLDGGAGADAMFGGLGDDTYMIDNLRDRATEASAAGGNDHVLSLVSFQIAANIERLTLTGTGHVNGFGNELGNVLTGNSGNNILGGGAGADTMAGGLGNDIYEVDNGGDVTTELAGEGTDTVRSSVTRTLGANLEHLVLTGLVAANGTGNELSNNLTGNAAANVLTGLAGNDRIEGGGGADRMVGGLGDDTYVIDGLDTLVEVAGEGSDTVISRQSYTLLADFENLTLSGSLNIAGTGNALNNVLNGNDGNNQLDGGAGADSMFGGRGNDIYIVDNAGDRATEVYVDGGTDLVISYISFSIAGNVENLNLIGSGATTGIGNGLANVINGNNAANFLVGGLGADTLNGGLGNDTYLYRSSAESSAAAMDRIFVSSADKIDLSQIDSNPAATGNNAFAFIGAGAFSGTAGQLRAYGSGSAWFVEADIDGDGIADLMIDVTTAGQPLVAANFVV
jgi:Ca2+-binding RTX toxin-like protein